MKKFKLISVLIFASFGLTSCQESNNIEKHTIGGLSIYEMKCGDNIYFSTLKPNCKSLPRDYFSVKGDSENYFCIFLRNKNNRLEVYSPYNTVIKKGKIDDFVKIIEYTDYRSNIFIEDSIKRKSYVIDGTIN